ncbi:MAG: hypothetical protein GX541_08125 [Clostridiales bacterium]|nr:hypothetical protein [Clostridiales bacterium]
MNRILVKTEADCVNLYLMKSPRSDIAEIAEVPLEKSFQNSGFMEKPVEFHRFIITALKNRGIKCKNYTLILDNSYILSKDFTHNKAFGNQLSMLASVEAEALIGNTGDYSMLTQSYGTRTFLDGFYKSYLYVLPKRFLLGLDRAFKKHGHKLDAVVANSTAFNQFADTYKQKAETGYTAFCNFGKYRTLLSIYENKEFVHEGYFTSIYHDIIKVIKTELQLSDTDAEKLFRDVGINPSERIPRHVSDKINVLINAAALEISRSANIAAAVERKELAKIIITGTLTTIPGFKEFFTEAFGTRTEVYDYDDTCYLPYALQTKLDFLVPIKRQARKKTARNAVFLIMTFSALAAFALQPLALMYYSKQYDAALEKSQSEEYAEVKKLMNNEKELKKTCEALESDLNTISKTRVKTAEKTRKLLSGFSGVVIKSIEYNNVGDVFDVTFAVPSQDDFINIKNRIMSSGTFEVAVPFSFAGGEEKICKVSLKYLEPAGKTDKEAGK